MSVPLWGVTILLLATNLVTLYFATKWARNLIPPDAGMVKEAETRGERIGWRKGYAACSAEYAKRELQETVKRR